MINDPASISEDARAKLPQILADLKALISAVHPTELLSHLQLFLMHASDEFPDTEELAKRQVRAEYVAWTILHDPHEAPADEVFIDGSILTPLEQGLDAYFANYTFSLFPDVSDDETENAKRDLIFRIQGEALHVRGEGNTKQVKDLALGMYGPHAAWMQEHLGFDIDQAFRYVEAMAELIADKVNERKAWAREMSVQALQTYSQILLEDPESMDPKGRRLHETITQMGADEMSQRYGFISMFSKLRESVGFTPREIAERLGDAEPTSQLLRFIDRMAQPIDGKVPAPDPLGFNPLAERPLVLDEGLYFMPVLAAAYDSLLSTFHFDLWRDESYRDVYDKTRAQWLEQQALEAFAQLFPQGDLHWSLTYGPKATRQEVDGLVLYDNKLIFIECKWKSLTMSARLGNVEAARIDVDKSIGASYSQSSRARDYVRSAKAPISFLAADGQEVVIDSAQVSEIYLVSLLGRGALAVLAANLPRLVPLGMFAAGEFPWALSLTDLRLVCEILEFPSQLFDYIRRRDAVMHDNRFLAHDEWDLLGLYLDGHLDPTDPAFAGAHAITLSGFDQQLDQYLRAQIDERLPQVDKPTRKIPASLSQTIHSIENSDQPRRSDFVIALLALPDQWLKELGTNLEQVVAKTSADHKIHSFTAYRVESKTGVAVVCSHSDLSELEWRLPFLCCVKKYQMKAKTWLGIGIDVSLPAPPHLIAYLSADWQEDQALEQHVRELERSGNIGQPSTD